jgi:hypothetical protein
MWYTATEAFCRAIALHPHSPSDTHASIALVRAANLLLFGNATSLCLTWIGKIDLPVTFVPRTSSRTKSGIAANKGQLWVTKEIVSTTEIVTKGEDFGASVEIWN